jgi:hypothetical protein
LVDDVVDIMATESKNPAERAIQAYLEIARINLERALAISHGIDMVTASVMDEGHEMSLRTAAVSTWTGYDTAVQQQVGSSGGGGSSGDSNPLPTPASPASSAEGS